MSGIKLDFVAGFVIALLLATLTLVISDYRRSLATKAVASNHIKTVMTIDKNCNECHLGASFINLFKHEAVVSNDNVVNEIMDKAHIKRW